MIRINTLPVYLDQEATRFPAILDSCNDKELRYQVIDQQTFYVTFHLNNTAECNCKSETVCPHLLSAYEKAIQTKQLNIFTDNIETYLGQRMLKELNRIMPGGEGIRLLSGIRVYQDGRVGFGLSIGQDRLFSVKNIGDFLTAHRYGTSLEISEKFTYHPISMRFSKEDERLLSILSNYIPPKAETAEEWENHYQYKDNSTRINTAEAFLHDGRFVILEGAFLYAVLHYFENHEFVFINQTEKNRQSQIRTLDLPFVFEINLHSSLLTVSAQGFEQLRLLSPDGRFIVWNEKLVHIHAPQARICKMLCESGFTFTYNARNAEEALSTLLPSLSTIGTVVPSGELPARLINEKLNPIIYLDLVNQYVEARVEFRYGDYLINPFESASLNESSRKESVLDETGRRKLLARDGRLENELIAFLADAGFTVQSGKIVLRKSKDILAFCTRGVLELEKHSTIYASADFEKIKPRKLKSKAVFSIVNSHLIMKLVEESGKEVEAMPILKAIAAHQDYVRLKNGEFLDIRDLSGLSPVAQELIESARIDQTMNEEENRELSFHTYRSIYMVNMLKAAGVNTEIDSKVEKTVSAIGRSNGQSRQYLPEALISSLTSYQKQGVNWIFSLYDAKMGGILADEMGLGKTIQIIAAMTAAKGRDGHQFSLIVTPTSLTYHWLAEFKRFSRDMVVRPILGPRAERRKTIEEAIQANDVDVLLISYPLIRRDADLLESIPFRFVVLDEAQSVKNAQSLGAACVKGLKAEARYAITGTPMENHTGELWSLFDFILPGYMGTQGSFLHRYGGGEYAEELLIRIRPFLLRRLKSEVMKNLPKKNEQVLYAAMTSEQERIYFGLLQTLREHVGKSLAEGNLQKTRIQILSLLLKLRQVCCHPKLLLDDYDGTSGKMELLVQIIQTGLGNQHRILIFSQFVGMLHLIRKRLIREGIQPFYLDGNTRPETRQELCDRFNSGEGKIFLISLKAGGTGLNLTGADLVIHYDPWWNPAAEDQATDRVHRIGQSRDVEVIRLISQDTIEEKVTEMGQQKRNLFEKVIVAGETDLSSLTEEDIRMLFFSN